MPRYVNLKGSMNTFDNNRPVLSSSERLKNKRDKTIYQAEKQRFQNHKTCGNKNVKYYDNGTIRSMQGYKLQQSLARGNVLCEDCNDRGTLCGSTTRSNFSKIEMSNNLLSEFWGGGGVGAAINNIGGNYLVQTPGFNVIQSDISGVWGQASLHEKSKSDLSGGSVLPGSGGTIPMPYGYVNNLIKVPRNLDGNLVVIDGSNVLFPADMCVNLNRLSREELFPYMKLSNLKTLVKVRGIIPLIHPTPPEEYFVVPSTCNDISYNVLPGTVITMYDTRGNIPTGGATWPLIFAGTILSLCCVREMHLTSAARNNETKEGTYGVFDMYIEVFNISNPWLLSFIVNTIPETAGTKGWIWPSSGSTTFPFALFELSYWKSVYGLWPPGGNNYVITDGLVESVKIIQGLPNLNQTVGNTTKQSYMSCLEDGTKKINFATDNVKKNTIITGYCSGK